MAFFKKSTWKPIFRKSTWKLITLELWGLEEFDLQLCGRQVTDRLWETTQAPLYFAHYSDPATRTARVEIKTELDWTTEQIKAFFQDDLWTAKFLKEVQVAPFDASPAHAQAYLLSRELRGKGDEAVKDVLHWTLNMAGYNYLQEVRLLSEHTAYIAGNLEKGMR